MTRRKHEAELERTQRELREATARAETAEAALAALREAVAPLVGHHKATGIHETIDTGAQREKVRAALAVAPADLATRDARFRAEALREAATVVRGIRNASPNPFAALREAACGLETMADEAERGAR